MKKIATFLSGIIITLTVFAQEKVQTPAEIYGQLFTDVQMAKVFPDSKTFADCVPKKDPEEIVKEYKEEKYSQAVRFNLKQFVTENFDLPKAPQSGYVTKEKNIVTHINDLWNVLKREPDQDIKGSSLLPLPYPYIVPGGRFREVYYWDSYFTMLGLKESGKVDMIENMVKNFAYLIDTYGHIPNGNRSYYISRSQPPFFSLMVELLAGIKGDSVYLTYMPAMEKEYNFWMDGADKLKPGDAYRRVVMLPDGTIMNRYWDDAATPRPEGYSEDVEAAEKSGRNKEEMYRNLRAGAESGIDFSSRWFADKKNISTIEVTNFIPVDLNALMVHLEKTIAKARKLQNKNDYENLLKKSWQREASINKYCWNSSLQYYTDYNFKTRKQSMVVTPAGMYPFCMMTHNMESLKKKCEQATVILKKKLLQSGGIQTTENNTGQQWDAPNGWAPLEWMCIWGLNRCGQKTLAKTIAERWMHLNIAVFLRTGKLMEKYNVVNTKLEAGGGEYAGQDGFGWTNGVLLALIAKYGLPD